jgi:hypothetical protein
LGTQQKGPGPTARVADTEVLSAPARKSTSSTILQDAEMLRDSGQVYLGWAGDGAEIVKVLSRHGLNPVWDGTDDRRILITVPVVEEVPK